MNSAHVFVCYSALSHDAAVRIASTFLPKSGEQFHLLKLFAGPVPPAPTYVNVVEMEPSPESRSEWLRPFAMAKFFSRFLQELEGVHDIVAYIPHPFEIPGNYLAFGETRVRQLEMLPDGLLNYVHRSLSAENSSRALRLTVRQRLRVIAASTYGLEYKPYASGHLTQYEAQIYAVTWTDRIEGLLTKSGDVIALPIQPQTSVLSPETTSILVVDQEISQLVDADLEARMRARLEQELQCVPSRQIEVLYKAHPRGKNRFRRLAQLFPAARDLSGPQLAEDIIQSGRVVAVFGFFSTPLFLPRVESVRRVAILPLPGDRGVKQRRLVHELRTVFIAAGTEVLCPGIEGPNDAR